MLAPWLIWMVPLIGILPTLFLKKEWKGYFSVILLGFSLLFSLTLISKVSGGKTLEVALPWISSLNLKVGMLLDPLSILMTNIVSFVGLLVGIYSISYIKKGIGRYYPLLLLFIGSMNLLLLSNNLLQMYVGWEMVGICSYSLIGHYYKKERAANAGMKAFIVTRIGDVALLLGILLLFVNTGTFSFSKNVTLIKEMKIPLPFISITSILFLIGAIGKSAQLPLHIWLPDAMEGPTTISALIHSATMVKAGVFLLLRTFPLFSYVCLWKDLIMYFGGITAFIAAIMALGTYDIKRILAYSTMSQIGYLFLAVGAGGLFASQFHLLNHAIFKALLFLSAGCIIHKVGTRNIKKMHKMHIDGLNSISLTFSIFLIGIGSLSGFPPLNGFWSKEAIISSLINYPVPFVLAIITIPITVLYSFKMLFSVFFGKNDKNKKKKKGEAHKSPVLMALPVLILGIGCILSGFLNNSLAKYLGMTFHSPSIDLTIISSFFLVLGFFPAYHYYLKKKPIPNFSFLNELISQGFYFDQFYELLFIKGSLKTAEIAKTLENNIAKINKILHKLTYEFSVLIKKRVEEIITNLNYSIRDISINISNIIFKSIEIGKFDQFNLSTSELGGDVSERLRKIQTGISNINLIFFIGGIIFIVLILLLV